MFLPKIPAPANKGRPPSNPTPNPSACDKNRMETRRETGTILENCILRYLKRKKNHHNKNVKSCLIKRYLMYPKHFIQFSANLMINIIFCQNKHHKDEDFQKIA